MKAIATFIFIIFISTSANAQVAGKEVKTETFSAGVELNINIKKVEAKENGVARLYKFKNSRIKKALNFKTKRDKAKIA